MVHMTRVQVFVPFRNKDAEWFANQLGRGVTEHGLNAVTGKINAACLVNDDFGIRIFL